MTWKLDTAHSEIGFKLKHMMVATVRGKFREFDADVTVDENDLAASAATFRIKTASVDTGTDQRDEHLRSGDFFNAGEYPEIVFTSRSIKTKGENVEIEGDLTIRDVTKPVVFKGDAGGPFTDPWGQKKVGLSAEAQINRKDWGLDWNQVIEAGGLFVGDKVTLSIEAEFDRAA